MNGGFESKIWKRFAKFEQGDYIYMYDSNWDAIIYKPKVDIYFLGFGLTKTYENKNFTLVFKYYVDSTQS